MISHEGTPVAQQVPAEWRSKILHARLSVRETVLMGSDAPADRYEAMRGFSVMLGVADPAAAECVFQALAENGTVRMANQYGTPWMINCEQAA
jgi:PhnB protein